MGAFDQTAELYAQGLNQGLQRQFALATQAQPIAQFMANLRQAKLDQAAQDNQDQMADYRQHMMDQQDQQGRLENAQAFAKQASLFNPDDPASVNAYNVSAQMAGGKPAVLSKKVIINGRDGTAYTAPTVDTSEMAPKFTGSDSQGATVADSDTPLHIYSGGTIGMPGVPARITETATGVTPTGYAFQQAMQIAKDKEATSAALIQQRIANAHNKDVLTQKVAMLAPGQRDLLAQQVKKLGIDVELEPEKVRSLIDHIDSSTDLNDARVEQTEKMTPKNIDYLNAKIAQLSNLTQRGSDPISVRKSVMLSVNNMITKDPAYLMASPSAKQTMINDTVDSEVHRILGAYTMADKGAGATPPTMVPPSPSNMPPGFSAVDLHKQAEAKIRTLTGPKAIQAVKDQYKFATGTDY